MGCIIRAEKKNQSALPPFMHCADIPPDILMGKTSQKKAVRLTVWRAGEKIHQSNTMGPV